MTKTDEPLGQSMQKSEPMVRYDKIIRIITISLTACILLLMFLGNSYLASEKDDLGTVAEFSDGWTDEAGEIISVPGDLENADGADTIYNTVPTLNDAEVLCIRSSQQDITIRVDGEIRTYYSTKDTFPIGKNSASRYVYARLYPGDSGKQLSITLETSSSLYTGRVNDILIGSESAIIMDEMNSYMLGDIGAVFLLVIGAIAFIFGIILYQLNKGTNPVTELGWIAIFTGLWKLCESRLRQFYFNSNSVMSMMAFVLLALIPIFILRFVDRVFEQRYRKVFLVLETASLVIFLLELILQLCNRYDFVETMMMTLAGCSICLIIIVGLLINEFIKKRVSEYRLTAIGLIIMAACAMLEILQVNSIRKDRLSVLIGIVILFFLTAVQELKSMITNITAEHIRQQKHAEELSLQVVMALSATVDAKDKYTNGHSKRVAEYSREIARRSGMSDAEVNEIYYMGLLHDIGKISVPDQIINKTARLDDNEFAEIKKHPASGFDILKNVTEMPNLQIGARWHHERYDGKGYPDGLSGEAIPLQARIIAVADSYDAMTSNRSYRSAMPQEKVCAEIERGIGTQFDPAFAKIMLQMIREDKDYTMREAPAPNLS